jgi:hypothetical protein
MKKAINTIFFILLIAIVVLAGKSNAQSIKISGTILDAATGQPLHAATVITKSLADKRFAKSEITDKAGSFVIVVPITGYYKIEVGFIGYKEQVRDSILIDEKHAVIGTFFLVSASKELKSVTVNSKIPFVSFKADKIILNVAQSPVAIGGNAYDILKNAPGIIAQGDDLNFRGKSITVLINGRPSNLSGEDLKNMLNNMQGSGVEKIEILPNPSPKYDAAGAVIVNIVTLKNKSFGTNYILTKGLGTGKYLRGNTGIDFNNRNKKVNFFGGYGFNHEKQYYKTDIIRYIADARITSKEYEERERDNHSAKLGLDYDFNKRTSLGILINGNINIRNRIVTNSAVLHRNINLVDSVSQVVTVGKAVFTNPTINVFFKRIIDTAGKELSINVDYLNYTKDWYDDFTNRYYDSKGTEYAAPDYLKDNSPAKINVYSVAGDYVLPTKKAKWEIGIKSSYAVTDNDVLWQANFGSGWKVDFGKTNHFIYKENVNAAYAIYYRAIKKWNIQAGLRVEQTNTVGESITLSQIDYNSYIDFFPSIQATFTQNAKHEFGVSYRKSIQRFGFDFVNPFIIYQNQYAYSKGNPYLLPQINHALSLSYTISQNLFIGVEYSHAIKALGVSYASQNNITVSSYDNFNSSDVGYLYVNYSKKLFDVWQMNAYFYGGYLKYNVSTSTYSQQQTQNPFYGIQLSNNLSFKKGFNAECTIAYRSMLVSGIFKMQPYYFTDAGISKSLLKNKLNLKLSLTDVFNTQVIKMRTDYQWVNSDKNVKAETRFVKLTARLGFGNKNVRGKRERQSKLGDIKNRIN